MRDALLLATALVCACREQTLPPDAHTAGAVTPQTSRLLYPSAPGSFVDLVESARHGVVGIRATSPVKSGPAAMFPGAPDSTPDVALGTGFLVETKGVYVLTNDHVIAGANDVHVVFSDGSDVPAKIMGRDPNLDLALLSVDVPRLHPMQMGDSDALRVGEWILVLGNPFGDGVTASVGIVSSTGHDSASLVGGRTLTYRSYLQIDARVHRGNSGGPVLDTAGQVIGVAIAPGDRPGELAFAIPINHIKDILDPLREHGQVSRGWLGAFVKPLTLDVATALGLSSVGGALVTEVRAGSPAARGGLRMGDVILQWGKTKVDHRSLRWVIAGAPIGKVSEVTIWRNKAEMKLGIATEKMPE
jgi:S1-C subfamily serine protease